MQYNPYQFALPDEQIREIQRGYLRFLRAAAGRVLDIGSGQGQFLDIASAAGHATVGIERHAPAAEACRARGHEVHVEDAVEGLQRLDGGFDLILVSHLIEHLLPAQAQALVAGTSRLLNPHGALVVVTPNTKNLAVGSHLFWLDPTHVRPYPDALVAMFMASADLDVESMGDDPLSRRRGLWRMLPARGVLRGVVAGVDTVVVGRRAQP
jgi:2-polyprenyl-3-methyl-5-hydroxy-6-metoxy-1,4-benzoquinol methylase